MPTHANAPLSPEGRRRLCLRIDEGRPISHVAIESGVSRATLTKWYRRWQEHGEQGLHDHTSRPQNSPTAIPDDIVAAILQLRRAEKWGKARIAAHLTDLGMEVSDATVHRTLVRHGLSRVVNMDRPTGELNRVVRYEHPAPGEMIHVDIKKVGRIPIGGGAAHTGKPRENQHPTERRKKGHRRVGMTFLHSAVDDYSRLAYTEVLDNEQGVTAANFWTRSTLFFSDYGITRIHRCLTDNGASYRSRAFNEALEASRTTHKYTRPYTPKTNGKVERYNQTMAREWLYRRVYFSEEDRTEALADFLQYYNHERPHSALGYKPPISRTLSSGPATPRAKPAVIDLPETESTWHLFDL